MALPAKRKPLPAERSNLVQQLLTLVLTPVQKEKVKDLIDGGFTNLHSHLVFPVGSVFILVTINNPHTLLGYGTWVEISQTQFPSLHLWRRTA